MSPVLAIHGDEVYLAWLKSRHWGTSFEVHLRRFRVDEILSADTPTASPASFALTSVYPQPARDRVTIAYTLAPEMSHAGETEITIYDFLGRVVRRQASPVTGSSGSASISTERFPAGAYRAVVRQGKHWRTAKFLVVK
jgi:hypothetical protein